MTEVLWKGKPSVLAAWGKAAFLLTLMLGGEVTQFVSDVGLTKASTWADEKVAEYEAAACAVDNSTCQPEPIEVPSGIDKASTWSNAFGNAFGWADLGWGALAVVLGARTVRATEYHASNDGLRVHSQFFVSKDRLVPWDKIACVTWKQGLVDRAFGLTRINVSVKGDRDVSLVGLRNPVELHALLLSRCQ